MTETSVRKVNAQSAPTGAMGQRYLASGTQIGMRLWQEEKPQDKSAASRACETVGYVLDGRAELHVEGQKTVLEPGDSWVVPKGAETQLRDFGAFYRHRCHVPARTGSRAPRTAPGS
jgi:mannose-6-phosphate isomerase-like protein (cupin superfamily)